MKITSILLLSLLVIAHSFADGLPTDEKGNITVPHTVITPTPSQVEEMEVLQSITLSKEQWSELRKVAPNVPKRLSGILPVTYNDCTCGIDVEGLRLKDGRIAILHGEQTPESIARRIQPLKPLAIHCDHRGQFYLEGILVRFPILLEAIRLSKPIASYPEDRRQATSATIVPPAGMELTDPVFENRIVEVYQALASQGWNGGMLPSWISKE